MTERQVVDAARATISALRDGACTGALLELHIESLENALEHFDHDSNLGYARYTYKPRNTGVYRILAREGAQTQVNSIWYPAVVYQDVNSGNVYTRTAEDFRVKFRVFRTLQDAATWGGDF